MTPESVQHRRGEPVIVTDANGKERIGTIEFGDINTSCISVYCETGGRVIVDNFSSSSPSWRIRSDPGGARPVWERVSRI